MCICIELVQFIYHQIDIFSIWSFGVQNGLSVVEDKKHIFGGKEGSQGSQVLEIFNPRTDNLGESGKEMSTGSEKPVTADESTVVAKSIFDPIVVENCTLKAT
jgi:hypothetical protein